MASKKKTSILFASMLVSLSAVGSVMPSTGIIDWWNGGKSDKSEQKSIALIESINKRSEELSNKEGKLQISDYVNAVTQSSDEVISAFNLKTNSNYKRSYLSSDEGFTPAINKDNCRAWYSYIMSQSGNALTATSEVSLFQSIPLIATLNLGAAGGYLCPSPDDYSEDGIPMIGNVAAILGGIDLITYFDTNPPFRLVNTNNKLTNQKFMIEKPMLQADNLSFMKEMEKIASKIDKDKARGKLTQKALAGYLRELLVSAFKLYSNSKNAIPRNQMLSEVSPETCLEKYNQITQWAVSSLGYNYTEDKPMTTVQMLTFISTLDVSLFGSYACPSDPKDPDGGSVPWSVNQAILTILNAALYNLSPVDR